MAKLRIISFCLAMVMSVQMLPLAQIGFALSSNLWTEELPHSYGEDSTLGDTQKNLFPVNTHHFHFDICINAEEIYIHGSEQIPSNHSTDVVSPPPDGLS